MKKTITEARTGVADPAGRQWPGLVFLISLLAAMPAFGQSRERPAVVKVMPVRTAMVAPSRAMPGEIQALYRVNLKAESSGTLDHVADLGTVVETGETVAVIVDPAHALRLRELQQDVASAQARVAFLQGEARRLASMHKKNLASAREVEQNRSDLAQANSQRQAAEARLRQLQQSLKRLVLRAPFAGYVVEHLAQPGEYVRSGDPVVRLVSRRQRIAVNLPWRAAPYVKKGQQWNVILTDGSGGEQKNRHKARVMAMVPTVANASRQLTVFLDWAGKETETTLDGQPVTVFYPQAEAREFVLVPRDALVLRQGKSHVFRVRDHRAEKIVVIPGVGDGDWIAIRGPAGQANPLKPGDEVVVRGNERLRDGQGVRILEASAENRQ